MFKPISYTSVSTSDILEEEKKFTLDELAKYNGKNGKAAYIAYNGKVYDVSDSPFWMDGEHLGVHQAGKDLTDEIDAAPHGPENLKRIKAIGTLIQ